MVSVALDSIVITRASLRDLFAAHALERACFGVDAWGYFEIFVALVAPGQVRLKVEIGGQMIGLVIGDSNPFERAGWIATLGVHPDYQRRGIGRRLLAECEAALRQSTLKLTVRQSNHSAIALYRQFGYRQVSVWPRYYASGDDGIVMEKRR